MRVPLAAALLAAFVAAAPAGAVERLNGFSGPRALRTVDLAGRWSFTPAGRPATTIRVPGGGWYKQGFTDVYEATYSRRVRIPRLARDQATRLELGAVNHQATLYLDGRRVGTQTTSYTPQVWDLTGRVRPGRRYTIALRVKGRGALYSSPGGPPGAGEGYAGPVYTVPTAAEWSEAVPQGIFRSAALRVYPPVRVAEARVRPSVAHRTLAADVWIANATDRRRRVRLAGTLRSSNHGRWQYPHVPRRVVWVGPHRTARVTLGPLRWRAAPRSYWWPNVPYRRGYRAQLHELTLRVGSARRVAARYRFGFRELRQAGDHYELNGVRANLRGDSLQGAMYDRIDRGGKGDAYDTYPGFLRPSRGSRGWPKALDNYQRLNYSVIRIHQEPASPYMLDKADQMGQMLIGETAIRGSESHEDFVAGRRNFVRHERDLVVRDRNHASVVRWSQANEPDASRFDSLGFERELYRTVTANDPTRPVSVDVTSNPYDEIRHSNFATFQHYVNDDGSIATGYTDDVHPRADRPFGRGEFIWPQDTTRQGFTWFATATEKMREKDPSDIRPYALAGAWASVVPGVRSDDFVTDNYVAHPLYGEDNLPHPWSNPQVRRVQAAFHPLLVADRDFWERNKHSDALGSWPTPTGGESWTGGRRYVRHLVVFDDTFGGGGRVRVHWELRRGSPRGPLATGGAFTVAVPLGEHRVRDIAFTAPRAGGDAYLVLSASKRGPGMRFRDTGERVRVVPAP